VLSCYTAPRTFGRVIDKRKAEVAGYAVAAFVVVLLAMRLLHPDAGGGSGQSVSLDQSSPARATATGARSARPAAGAGRLLVVDVAGEVRSPGVYRVPAGSRADTAVQRAGGITRHGEPSAVNLAMPLHDGQQIVVPRRGATGAAAPGSPAGQAAGASPAGAPSQPISLSSATVEQLDTLDGIGPTLAGRIIQYRDAHGGFRSVDELRQVDGIGDKRFAALRKVLQP
jgi:competence protein ComEA